MHTTERCEPTMLADAKRSTATTKRFASTTEARLWFERRLARPISSRFGTFRTRSLGLNPPQAGALIPIFDLSEREAANSAEAATALFEPIDHDENQADAEAQALRTTTITTELTAFSPDLDRRWRGALFALHRENPDASRHFCTSARETVSNLLLLAAPDDAVKNANPNYLRTPDGDVSRRARIHYCLGNHGDATDELVDFVEADIDNVIALFDDFNSGTHGESGRFPLPELAALKTRVEDAIKFVYGLTRHSNRT